MSSETRVKEMVPREEEEREREKPFQEPRISTRFLKN
jgi:hypothetical protein